MLQFSGVWTPQSVVRDSASPCFGVWVSCVQTELWFSVLTGAQQGLVQCQALTGEQCWECCACLVLKEDLTCGILFILSFWFVLYGRALGRQHMVTREVQWNDFRGNLMRAVLGIAKCQGWATELPKEPWHLRCCGTAGVSVGFFVVVEVTFG